MQHFFCSSSMLCLFFQLWANIRMVMHSDSPLPDVFGITNRNQERATGRPAWRPQKVGMGKIWRNQVTRPVVPKLLTGSSLDLLGHWLQLLIIATILYIVGLMIFFAWLQLLFMDPDIDCTNQMCTNWRSMCPCDRLGQKLSCPCVASHKVRHKVPCAGSQLIPFFQFPQPQGSHEVTKGKNVAVQLTQSMWGEDWGCHDFVRASEVTTNML